MRKARMSPTKSSSEVPTASRTTAIWSQRRLSTATNLFIEGEALAIDSAHSMASTVTPSTGSISSNKKSLAGGGNPLRSYLQTKVGLKAIQQKSEARNRDRSNHYPCLESGEGSSMETSSGDLISSSNPKEGQRADSGDSSIAGTSLWAWCAETSDRSILDAFIERTDHDLYIQCREHLDAINQCTQLQQAISDEMRAQAELDKMIYETMKAKTQRLDKQTVISTENRDQAWVNQAFDDLRRCTKDQAHAHKVYGLTLLNQSKIIQHSLNSHRDLMERTKLDTSNHNAPSDQQMTTAGPKSTPGMSFVQATCVFESVRKPQLKLISELDFLQTQVKSLQQQLRDIEAMVKNLRDAKDSDQGAWRVKLKMEEVQTRKDFLSRRHLELEADLRKAAAELKDFHLRYRDKMSEVANVFGQHRIRCDATLRKSFSLLLAASSEDPEVLHTLESHQENWRSPTQNAVTSETAEDEGRNTGGHHSGSTNSGVLKRDTELDRNPLKTRKVCFGETRYDDKSGKEACFKNMDVKENLYDIVDENGYDASCNRSPVSDERGWDEDTGKGTKKCESHFDEEEMSSEDKVEETKDQTGNDTYEIVSPKQGEERSVEEIDWDLQDDNSPSPNVSKAQYSITHRGEEDNSPRHGTKIISLRQKSPCKSKGEEDNRDQKSISEGKKSSKTSDETAARQNAEKASRDVKSQQKHSIEEPLMVIGSNQCFSTSKQKQAETTAPKVDGVSNTHSAQRGTFVRSPVKSQPRQNISNHERGIRSPDTRIVLSTRPRRQKPRSRQLPKDAFPENSELTKQPEEVSNQTIGPISPIGGKVLTSQKSNLDESESSSDTEAEAEIGSPAGERRDSSKRSDKHNMAERKRSPSPKRDSSTRKLQQRMDNVPSRRAVRDVSSCSSKATSDAAGRRRVAFCDQDSSLGKTDTHSPQNNVTYSGSASDRGILKKPTDMLRDIDTATTEKNNKSTISTFRSEQDHMDMAHIELPLPSKAKARRSDAFIPEPTDDSQSDTGSSTDQGDWNSKYQQEWKARELYEKQRRDSEEEERINRLIKKYATSRYGLGLLSKNFNNSEMTVKPDEMEFERTGTDGGERADRLEFDNEFRVEVRRSQGPKKAGKTSDGPRKLKICAVRPIPSDPEDGGQTDQLQHQRIMRHQQSTDGASFENMTQRALLISPMNKSRLDPAMRAHLRQFEVTAGLFVEPSPREVVARADGGAPKTREEEGSRGEEEFQRPSWEARCKWTAKTYGEDKEDLNNNLSVDTIDSCHSSSTSEDLYTHRMVYDRLGQELNEGNNTTKRNQDNTHLLSTARAHTTTQQDLCTSTRRIVEEESRVTADNKVREPNHTSNTLNKHGLPDCSLHDTRLSEGKLESEVNSYISLGFRTLQSSTFFNESSQGVVSEQIATEVRDHKQSLSGHEKPLKSCLKKQTKHYQSQPKDSSLNRDIKTSPTGYTLWQDSSSPISAPRSFQLSEKTAVGSPCQTRRDSRDGDRYSTITRPQSQGQQPKRVQFLETVHYCDMRERVSTLLRLEMSINDSSSSSQTRCHSVGDTSNNNSVRTDTQTPTSVRMAVSVCSITW